MHGGVGKGGLRDWNQSLVSGCLSALGVTDLMGYNMPGFVSLPIEHDHRQQSFNWPQLAEQTDPTV